MSDRPTAEEDGAPATGITIRFADKFAQSPQFIAVFNEGMALVEETAAYLDGDGRTESRVLSRMTSLSYATESMRLTTRLMQLASWLLLHRAVNEGELTVEEARTEKRKVRLQKLPETQTSQAFGELPLRLKDLIARSRRLHERIVGIDRMMHSGGEPHVPEGRPLKEQLGALQAAFGND